MRASLCICNFAKLARCLRWRRRHVLGKLLDLLITDSNCHSRASIIARYNVIPDRRAPAESGFHRDCSFSVYIYTHHGRTYVCPLPITWFSNSPPRRRIFCACMQARVSPDHFDAVFRICARTRDLTSTLSMLVMKCRFFSALMRPRLYWIYGFPTVHYSKLSANVCRACVCLNIWTTSDMFRPTRCIAELLDFYRYYCLMKNKIILMYVKKKFRWKFSIKRCRAGGLPWIRWKIATASIVITAVFLRLFL